MPLTNKEFERTIFSVSKLTSAIKGILEGEFLPLWVEGEITSLRIQSSGHAYFSLKDANSQISIVLFKGNFPSNLTLKDGQNCLIYGDLSVYEPRGTYQIMAKLVLPGQEGLLRLEFEKLKERLNKEGYFDISIKKHPPLIPKTIGLITSPTGAALQDFIATLKAKDWRGHLIILPSLVQGKDAPAKLIEAITQAASLPLDLLVITRGGGSMEDLWCFNDESLVKAIFQYPKPVISAVGHEIDFTLCDFVCDLRLPTPTAAAEYIASSFAKSLTFCSSLHQRLQNSYKNTIKQYNLYLQTLGTSLRQLSPQKRIEHYSIYLDDKQRQLQHAQKNVASLSNIHLNTITKRFSKLNPAQYLLSLEKTLIHYSQQLESHNPQKIFKKGFALIKDINNENITSIQNLTQNQVIHLTLADGLAQAKILTTSSQIV